MSSKFVDIEVDELDEQITEEPDQTKIELPSEDESENSEIESTKEEEVDDSEIEETENSTSAIEDEDNLSDTKSFDKGSSWSSTDSNRGNRRNPVKRGNYKMNNNRGNSNYQRGNMPNRKYNNNNNNQYHDNKKNYNRPNRPTDPFPEDARAFISRLWNHIKNKEENIDSLYESWSKTPGFKSLSWPNPDLIAPAVDNDNTFMTLYQEIYYRRQFAADISPSFDTRVASWKNYLNLFDILKKDSINLSLRWIWDIINEFVYQWQAFSQFRCTPKVPFDVIKNNLSVWDTSRVILTLMDAIDQAAEQEKPSNLIKYVGYFSSVGLFRANCLLGDYNGALDTISSLVIYNKNNYYGQKPPYQIVPSCFVTLFYHLGLCKMMTREYSEATKTLTSALVFLNRIKTTKASPEDTISKRFEQMQMLLAICLSLCRQKVTDEQVASNLQEALGDSMTKMQSGNEGAFQEVATKALPKYVHPAPPPYDSSDLSVIYQHNNQVLQLQLNTFLSDIKQQLLNSTIRSYLRIYSSVEISKLATFLEMQNSDLTDYLMCYRHKTRFFQTEISFALEKGMIHINDTRQPKLFQGLFIYFSHKLHESNEAIKKIK